MEIDKINIRPSVSILSALRHLNYKIWFALAEFVDNSIDSFLKYQKEIKEIEHPDFKLIVEIKIDSNNKKIIISDNAAGIHQQDFARAFRTAELPPDNTGLSEFGMGMKSASCWFSNYWQVTSTALGEDFERIVIFDINKIVNDRIEELVVKNKKENANIHKTTIELFDIHNIPRKKTLGKIKNHLSSIYRDFFRRGILDLHFNGELLEYSDPKTLNAPYYKNSDNESILWKREIPENFEVRKGLIIKKGFVAILDKMKVGKSGLALFRRGRVIMGSADDGYKPYEIFGQAGSFKDKRIFGELHIEGFQVSHTKDAFKNDNDMQLFIELIADFLNETPSLLRQAEGYRARVTNKQYEKTAQNVVKKTVKTASEHLTKPLNEIRKKEPELDTKQNELKNIEKNNSSHEFFNISFNSIDWQISVELSWENNPTNWIEIRDKFIKNYYNDKLYKNVRKIGIRLALKHPFIISFAGIDKSRLEPLLRLAVAIAISEIAVKDSGANTTSSIFNTFRFNINKILTETFSKY